MGRVREARIPSSRFLKAWKSIGRFRGQSSFYTWIYRIVTNVTIDWLRKKQVKGTGAEFDDTIQLKEIDPASKTVPKAVALPYQQMEQAEIRPTLHSALEPVEAMKLPRGGRGGKS